MLCTRSLLLQLLLQLLQQYPDVGVGDVHLSAKSMVPSLNTVVGPDVPSMAAPQRHRNVSILNPLCPHVICQLLKV